MNSNQVVPIHRGHVSPATAVALVALILVASRLSASPISAQRVEQLAPAAIEAGLTFEQVATDLAFPMGMVVLPDDSLLVATSPSTSGNFYESTGEIVRLVDSDSDGTLDERSVVAPDLPGSLVAVARYESTIMVTSAAGGSEGITFLRAGETWDDPLTSMGELVFGFIGALHQSYALAVRPNPESDDAFDLFFNIGAGGNDTDGANARMGGLLTGVLLPSSVYMTTVTVQDVSVSLTDPIQVASGLRNASTLLIHPETGDLWIGDNGIDGLEEPIIAFSADEVNIVPANEIGTNVIDFGFPGSYVESATGAVVGDDTFFAVFLPLEGSEAEGIAGMVLIPQSFPEPYAGGLLAGFHGQFDLTGIENEENPARFVDPETGEQLDIISNDAPEIGHLDSMTATQNVIYIADFCATSMFASTECGIIYRLSESE